MKGPRPPPVGQFFPARAAGLAEAERLSGARRVDDRILMSGQGARSPARWASESCRKMSMAQLVNRWDLGAPEVGNGLRSQNSGAWLNGQKKSELPNFEQLTQCPGLKAEFGHWKQGISTCVWTSGL